MPRFSDSSGREWPVTITIGTVRRVKADLSVNLADIHEGDPPLMNRIATDPTFFCDVLLSILRPEIEKAGLPEDEFWNRLGGDVVKRAYDAFWAELRDFFHGLGRPEAAKAIEKQTRMIEAAIRMAEAKVDAIDVETALAEVSGNSSTKSPDTSA